ncbi:hypothetical protein LTR53_019678, partial [Teratosphaeriaceae sp. CCFEE 6253]
EAQGERLDPERADPGPRQDPPAIAAGHQEGQRLLPRPAPLARGHAQPEPAPPHNARHRLLRRVVPVPHDAQTPRRGAEAGGGGVEDLDERDRVGRRRDRQSGCAVLSEHDAGSCHVYRADERRVRGLAGAGVGQV